MVKTLEVVREHREIPEALDYLPGSNSFPGQD